MFRLSKTTIDEFEATDEIERVYHEIRQTLRVSGVNLNFRTWAAQKNLLPVLWDRLKPNCETESFERSSDELRNMAATAATEFSKSESCSVAGLGESQTFQLHEALKLYHFVNPKLLLFTSAVKLALDDELPREQSAATISADRRIVREIPSRMFPMMMVEEEPDDSEIQVIFDDIKQTLALQSVNSDYRTMALWPKYLKSTWVTLKPITQQERYSTASDRLRSQSRALAQTLPLPIELTRAVLEEAGADIDEAVKSTESFERLLPGLIINIAICLREFEEDCQLSESPWPAKLRSSGCDSNTGEGKKS